MCEACLRGRLLPSPVPCVRAALESVRGAGGRRRRRSAIWASSSACVSADSMRSWRGAGEAFALSARARLRR
eukprot:1192376-Pyramimonas_sp.AAC.1